MHSHTKQIATLRSKKCCSEFHHIFQITGSVRNGWDSIRDACDSFQDRWCSNRTRWDSIWVGQDSIPNFYCCIHCSYILLLWGRYNQQGALSESWLLSRKCQLVGAFPDQKLIWNTCCVGQTWFGLGHVWNWIIAVGIFPVETVTHPRRENTDSLRMQEFLFPVRRMHSCGIAVNLRKISERV